MILLLFLVSLAVLYYIVPVPEPDAAPDSEPLARSDPSENAPPATEVTATPGVIALGRALDQLGRGVAPQPAPPTQPETRKVRNSR
ncbi:MAG: hypothetical protein ABSC23_08550 [Bryobacteraceae bacterium]